MAVDTATYLVDASVAQRAGLIGQRYVTKDGRYILDKRDLSRVRLLAEEYVTGLQGIQKISQAEAKRLIHEGGYNRGGQEIPTEETQNEEVQTNETEE